jgi:F-type H+-transporting ATPase subunit a
MLKIQPLNTLSMYVYIAIMQVNYILSPLDQFEIRDLLSLNISLLNNTHISLTNIGLYLSVGIILIISYSLLATNNNKIIPNS